METHHDYINDPRFSRTFELPLINCHAGPFTVKYADYDHPNEAQPEEEKVLLFFGPLMGSRLLHIPKDNEAKKHKIRIISPDSPGIGGTDAVDVAHRMSVWREAIPALLSHFGIRHVSLACHSAGTVYALDLVLHHPERPYLAIGAPWILPSHTGSTAMSIVQCLPTGLLRQPNKLSRLINNHVGPMVGASFGFSGALATKFLQPRTRPAVFSPTSDPGTNDTTNDPEDEDATRLEEKLWPVIIERVYAEGIGGMSTDAVLLIGKVEWGDWGDYDSLVPRLARALREDVLRAGVRLRVNVLYAESDFLVGKLGDKGPLCFDSCWNADGDIFDYHRVTVGGADHDSVWNLRLRAVQEVFSSVGSPVT